MGFASCLRYCRDVAHWRPSKLCTMFGHLLGWYTIYTFWGLLSLREFCQLQSSLCVQVLCSPVFAVLLHGTPDAASAKLCGAEQRAPPIFGRVAITLGIGPHSSYCLCVKMYITRTTFSDWLNKHNNMKFITFMADSTLQHLIFLF